MQFLQCISRTFLTISLLNEKNLRSCQCNVFSSSVFINSKLSDLPWLESKPSLCCYLHWLSSGLEHNIAHASFYYKYHEMFNVQTSPISWLKEDKTWFCLWQTCRRDAAFSQNLKCCPVMLQKNSQDCGNLHCSNSSKTPHCLEGNVFWKETREAEWRFVTSDTCLGTLYKDVEEQVCPHETCSVNSSPSQFECTIPLMTFCNNADRWVVNYHTIKKTLLMFISTTQKQKENKTQNDHIELISSLLNRACLAMIAGVITVATSPLLLWVVVLLKVLLLNIFQWRKWFTTCTADSNQAMLPPWVWTAHVHYVIVHLSSL